MTRNQNICFALGVWAWFKTCYYYDFSSENVVFESWPKIEKIATLMLKRAAIAAISSKQVSSMLMKGVNI